MVAQWVKDEATYLDAGERPWIEQCDVCGENFETIVDSYWCDDCYAEIRRAERDTRRRGCYYCDEVVDPTDDIGGSWPVHRECAGAMMGYD